ncbi:hypothetical protein ACR71G_15655 [Xenorhabdus bovienii]|uniref:hypothetical protein n=1 Tax=Xenorhabdus bovienii TaxID=40576 RepID=UPI003DA3B4A5
MTLPYVNQFNPPYEQWQTRKPTQEEINDRITRKLHPLEWDAEIKIRCVDTIDTPEKAADYTLRYNDYEVIDHAITNSLNSPKSSYEQCQKKCLPRHQKYYQITKAIIPVLQNL